MKKETAAQWLQKIIESENARRADHYRMTHAILGWNKDANHKKTCQACMEVK